MYNMEVICDRERVRERLLDVLASTWRKWKAQQANKIKGTPHSDVFAHRLKVAGYEPTFTRALEKLCHGLSLQSIYVPPEILRELEECEEVTLSLMRHETVFLVALAMDRIPSWKDVKEGDEL